jgi:transposase
VERAEAEVIYEAGREVVVEVLLRMDRQIEQLGARMDRLEREVRKNSRNSSQPPSSDRPGSESSGRPKGRSPRQQGAQPGHGGKGRDLLPAWAVHEVVEHWPERCDCGHVFCQSERVAVREPARYQVCLGVAPAGDRREWHRCQRVRCPGCGSERTGDLPTEDAGSAFGPRLQAAVASLAVRNRISRRDTVELMAELFGARSCAGSVDQILTRTAGALELPTRISCAGCGARARWTWTRPAGD